jgi:hypothetical protein
MALVVAGVVARREGAQKWASEGGRVRFREGAEAERGKGVRRLPRDVASTYKAASRLWAGGGGSGS